MHLPTQKPSPQFVVVWAILAGTIHWQLAKPVLSSLLHLPPSSSSKSWPVHPDGPGWPTLILMTCTNAQSLVPSTSWRVNYLFPELPIHQSLNLMQKANVTSPHQDRINIANAAMQQLVPSIDQATGYFTGRVGPSYWWLERTNCRQRIGVHHRTHWYILANGRIWPFDWSNDVQSYRGAISSYHISRN